jgi:hypothetical protein
MKIHIQTILLVPKLLRYGNAEEKDVHMQSVQFLSSATLPWEMKTLLSPWPVKVVSFENQLIFFNYFWLGLLLLSNLCLTSNMKIQRYI